MPAGHSPSVVYQPERKHNVQHNTIRLDHGMCEDKVQFFRCQSDCDKLMRWALLKVKNMNHNYEIITICYLFFKDMGYFFYFIDRTSMKCRESMEEDTSQTAGSEANLWPLQSGSSLCMWSTHTTRGASRGHNSISVQNLLLEDYS